MLDTLINALAYGSLLFAATAAYLQLNKLWSRKHIEEVADSVSIPGILVESIPLFFFGLYFINKGEVLGIIDSLIWLTAAVLVVMIGAGFWVKGRRKRGFWRLVVDSISKERSEMSTLARQLVRPSAAPQLLRVLTSMAAVDGEVDQREKDIIEPFARDWNLVPDWESGPDEFSGKSRIVHVQEAVDGYLATTPPLSQVGHLQEILEAIIAADDEVVEEEQVAFGEAAAALQNYLSAGDTEALYQVVIAPQDKDQEEAVELMLVGVEPHDYAGGKGYTVGHFYSRAYADVVCLEYRAMGFFTVVVDEAGLPATAEGD